MTTNQDLSLQDRINRGKAAKELQESLLFEEICDSVLNDHLASIAVSEPDDIEGRERHYLSVRAMREFRAHLTSIVDDGTIAQDQRDHEALDPESPV